MVTWIVYQADTGPGAAERFGDAETAARYKRRQESETKTRWVIRFRIVGAEPITARD